MEEDEVENFLKSEVPYMTESNKIKLRLKKFCYVIGFLLILWTISIIIVVNNKVQENKISWEEAYIKAREFISKLNPTQIKGLLNCTNNIDSINETNKNLCQAQIDNNENISFKGMCLQERTTEMLRFSNGTRFLWQSEINTAATFNKKLMYEIGKALGEESKERGINTLLLPSVNISNISDVLWESFGENPFYSGVCASEIIKGIQDRGVIATIKYFLGNDLKKCEIQASFDKNDLIDNYLEPFYRAIHDVQVGAVMVSNNCIENENLLANILRNILEFQGFIISDLWDINKKKCYNCSLLDLNIGKECKQDLSKEENGNDTFVRNQNNFLHLEDYEKNKRDNISAQRIIAAMYKMNQMNDYPKVDLYKVVENEERKKIQKEAAIESQVLLKNEDILPLKDNKKIVVIGKIFMKGDCGFEDTNEKNFSSNLDIPSEYNSISSKFGCFISPLEEIKNKSITAMSLRELFNKSQINQNNKNEINPLKMFEETVENLTKEIELDAAIVFVNNSLDGNYSVIDDGLDPILLNKSYELINIIKNYAKVIVVINALSFNNPSWLYKVNALLFSGYPGVEASQAIADILFGEVNPSGHLPFTIKFNDLSLLDYLPVINTKIKKIEANKENELKFNKIDSTTIIAKKNDNDMEKKIKQYYYIKWLIIAQRLLKKKETIFPFGYGLSYSSFYYTDLKLSMSKEGLTAEFSIKNESPYLGKAVPMMFLTFPKNIGNYPEHIFKGFEKIEIKPDETIKVKIVADDHDLSYFNVTQNKYVRVCEGKIKVYIAENANISETKLMAQINAKY